METTILALDEERSSLLTYIESQSITQAQLNNVREFASEVRERLGAVEEEFSLRRRITEILDVTGTLTQENNEQVVCARCVVGEDILSVKTTATNGLWHLKARLSFSPIQMYNT